MKWTKEKCKEEALKYTTRSEFQKKNHSSYNSALNNKWLDEICSHMEYKQKKNGYWTKEKCQEEALKYNTRMDFFNKNSGVYSKCVKKKWLDDVCLHMKTKKLRDYWVEETCKNEALKYKTRKEFSIKSSRAYQVCLENGWIDSFSHLNIKKYTKEFCISESKKYNTLKDLITNDFYLYNKILKNNWSDELFSHMIYSGNLHHRCIYAYEFLDNFVYVGLTYNINKRNDEHMKRGPVFKHIKDFNIYPTLIKLTDYLDIKEAKIMEREYLERYLKNGWKILNLSKTGGFGGNFKIWSKEKCLNEASKYKTKTEYLKNSSSYHAARKNGWLCEICSHMKKYSKQT